MVRPYRLGSCLVALLGPFVLGAQTAPDMAGILDRLERLERENRALTHEVQALRARLDGVAEPKSASGGAEVRSAGTDAPPTPLDEQLQIQERRVDELAQSKVEASQKSAIRLTGMALFNAFDNSRQSGGLAYPATAQPSAASKAGATMSQTIIGLDFRDPQTFLGGSVHGSVYMDFYSSMGNFSSPMRFRTGDIEIDWKGRSLMVGVEKPIFNPREPSSLAQVGVSPLTGAGNLWLWLPQARVEQDVYFASNAGLRAQMGVIQTREGAPYPGAAAPPGLAPSRPGLEGRYEFFYNIDDERRVELAPGFHMSQTHVAGHSVPSELVSCDWFFKPIRRVELTGAFYKGENVATLGNGLLQGYTIYGNDVDVVRSIGGWAQVTIHAAKRVDLHLFSGQQDDNNHDLTLGRIGKNLLYGGNVFYRLAPNVFLAFETTQLRTAYIGQGTLINNHYDLALAYMF
jgi:hypothetical protein